MTSRTRSRLTLLLLAALFAAPIVAAIVLHQMGWKPDVTKNNGALLQPPDDLRDLTLRRADGSRYEWRPEDRRWRIVAAPAAGCTRACRDLVDDLDKVWQLQGRRADRLDVLWFGALPEGAHAFRRLVAMQPDAVFMARLPDARAGREGRPPLYLIDPSGFLVMRYEPDADIAGVREDVAQLLK